MMTDFAKIDLKVKPLIQKCLEGMESAANSVNAEQVSIYETKFEVACLYSHDFVLL